MSQEYWKMVTEEELDKYEWPNPLAETSLTLIDVLEPPYDEGYIFDVEPIMIERYGRKLSEDHECHSEYEKHFYDDGTTTWFTQFFD